MRKWLWMVLICVLSSGVAAEDNAGVSEARKFFDNYLAKWRDYDASIAELYADDAVIIQKHVQKDGGIKENRVAVAKYKENIVKLMPENKKMNAAVYHESIEVQAEGDAYRIKAIVHSDTQKTKRPYSMLIRKNAQGNWLIVEETKTYKFD